jgi:hypothetical protein
MGRALSVLLVAAAAAGCKAKTPEPEKQAAAEIGGALTGLVQERLTASPYVYLRIKTPTGDVWAAVPEAAIETGAEVTVYTPMLMSKFESTTLKRTFDEVYFGTLTPPDVGAAGGSGAGGGGGNPHAGIQSTAAVDVGTVEKASGSDARTVAEVWEQKGSLEGKSVTIRGVVVKYNEGVMGKNWIHLQDGSGAAAQGTNDMTVTTLDGAAKGETILIKGTVRTNKDFGAGYRYAVIVEEAKVAKQ